MKKCARRILVCGMLVVCCWGFFLFRDRKKLNSGLIRFHVVAHSDSVADQTVKLHIRDVVLNSIQDDLKKITDIDGAKEYLQENIPKLQLLVDQSLEELGFTDGSHVTLCKEAFAVRHYDTFSLPAGVYDSLRIVIGEGKGKNWWCVSFPALCIPATASGFAEKAVSAGFSESLTQALSGNETYELHFFVLDQLGKLENIFFQE